MIAHLEALAQGRFDRLMIFMPPGSAKSTYAAMLFPAWFLAQQKGLNVIGTAYNAEHAEFLSGQCMSFVNEHADLLGYRLISTSRKLWLTDTRGIYRAAGAGGGITGRRADLVIIDDPFKGRAEAESAAERDTVWNWYRAEVVSRLKPGGRIVLINTRWHPDDLSGRLLSAMQSGTGAPWRVLNLPAIAEDNDALRRQPGEALWPEWEDRAALDRKRMEVGEREWAALFQQRPTPLEGTLFHPERIDVIPAAPVHGRIVRAWDLAATTQVGGSNPDYTVGVKMMREPSGRLIVLDVLRLRGGPLAVEQAILNTARQDGHGVTIGLPQDPGAAGKHVVQYLTTKLAGHAVDIGPETGQKETRAMPFASQVEVGNVALIASPTWNRDYLEELRAFPAGAHDDQVDASSRAFAMLTVMRAPMRISNATMARLGVPVR